MSARFVINPVIIDGGARKPKVSIMEDPGRAPKTGVDNQGQPFSIQPTYGHSSAISDGQLGQRNDICLSLVVGIDFSPLDADPKITTLFEMPDWPNAETGATLGKTPRQLGWGGGKVDRLRARCRQLTADSRQPTAGMDDDLCKWANEVAAEFMSGFDCAKMRTTVPGA